MINEKMLALGTKTSAIRELFEYGVTRKAEIGEDAVFDFSIGNPSIPAPSIVQTTLIDLLMNKDSVALHGYTTAAGDKKVRSAIAEYLNKEYKASIDPNYIYMTAGAAASLTITLNAICNEGDEVIVLAPFFPEYAVFVDHAKAHLVIVHSLEDNFQPDLVAFKKAITKNTKAVIINSPNNPTGVILEEKTIQAMTDIMRDKEIEFNHDIYLISDEPYRELIYNGMAYPFVTNYYKDSFVCYSFSKSLSLPGERIGYIIVNKEMNKAMEKFKAVCGSGRALGFVCAPALFQYMIPACLGYTSDLSVYKKNRDLMYNGLTKIGYQVTSPDGAFYLFVKALEEDDINFSKVAKKFELLLVPSDSFGFKGYVRISYCVKEATIINSMPSFKALYDYYNNGGKIDE